MTLPSRWMWEWRCCGHLWELLPSRLFPSRNAFQPRCPTCGGYPERHWFWLDRRNPESLGGVKPWRRPKRWRVRA